MRDEIVHRNGCWGSAMYYIKCVPGRSNDQYLNITISLCVGAQQWNAFNGIYTYYVIKFSFNFRPNFIMVEVFHVFRVIVSFQLLIYHSQVCIISYYSSHADRKLKIPFFSNYLKVQFAFLFASNFHYFNFSTLYLNSFPKIIFDNKLDCFCIGWLIKIKSNKPPVVW